MSRGAHHRLRIAPEEETDRTEVRAPGAGVQNDGQQASAEAACGLCRAATVEAVQSFAPQQRSLLCPLRENRRPIPTEVPCGHFWRHLTVTKGGKSAPRRKNRIESEGILPEVRIDFFCRAFSFFCAFVLIQKHQKIKHGEKERVPPPALAERSRKTPLFARSLRALAPLPPLLPLFSQYNRAGLRPAKTE